MFSSCYQLMGSVWWSVGWEEAALKCPGLVCPVPWLLCLDEARDSDGAKPFQGCVLQLHQRLCQYLLEVDLFSLQILADPKCSSTQAVARPAVGLILAP